MGTFFVTVLVLLLFYFVGRYLYYKSCIIHLADAMEAKQSYLLESESRLTSRHLLRLTEQINRLIHQNTQLQQARTNNLEQVEAIFGNMLQGAIILDEKSRILMVNQVLRSSFGGWMEGKDVVGKRLENLFSNSNLISIVNKTNAGDDTDPVELELIHGDDHRWVRVSGTLIRSSTPDAEDLTLLTFHDITHRNELETIRTEFVANVSHELRTPVTIIKGYVDTLVQDFATLTEEQKLNFINKLGRNVDRLHHLLLDLLELAKIESTDLGSSLENVSVNAVIRRVVANQMDRLEAHKMHVELALEAEEIKVQGDPSKLEQVFENLFQNAINYTPENTVLKVETRQDEQSLVICVEDNGPGIPEEDIPRIFERFYRVEKGRSRNKGGTGLGLSIVKRIISLHGGSVRADNVKNGGLRISITLPINKRSASQRGKPGQGSD